MIEPGWPLDELARRTTAALRRVALASASGRVRDLPDSRTIRYYTTLGLLDRPQGYRGRVALYGPRHLLQLVAIKRLQAEGRALSEVQQRLYGLSDAELAALASLPAGVVDLPAGAPSEAGPAAAPRPASRPFWKAAPAALDAVPPEGAASEARAEASAPIALRLAPSALLVLERPVRTLTDDDERALREAAAPLVRWLAMHAPPLEPSDES
jgi:DNA-binding transcriptional MerR regulator